VQKFSKNFSHLQHSTSARFFYRWLWQFSNEIFGATVISALFLCNVIARGARYRALIFATNNVWRYLNYSYRITPRNLCAVHLSGAYRASSAGIWVFFCCRTLSFRISTRLKIRESYGANKIDGPHMYRTTRTHRDDTMILLLNGEISGSGSVVKSNSRMLTCAGS